MFLLTIFNPFLTRELRITGFEGVPTEIYLKQHADKTDRQHADKTEYLVMFHGREESVKSTNVARNKPMSTDSSPKLEHAAWRNGGVVLLLPAAPAHAASARSNPARSTAPDRQVDDGFQQISHTVQHTSPGLACSPDKAKSGCRAPAGWVHGIPKRRRAVR